jgi:glycosyltransferase involved in cell wall biosynthesis
VVEPDLSRPRVSVGLPVYNGERYLEESILAVLGQTLTDLELVICDNASTDGTEAICRRYAALDGRIRYQRNVENIGGQRNHLRVFELSRGHYFRWAAHDDLIASEFLERCVGVLDSDDRYVLAFSRFDVINEVGGFVELGAPPPAFVNSLPHERLRAFWRSPRVHQVIYGVIRRDSLERTGLMGDWYASDRSLLIELALLGGFARIEEVLHHHREHQDRSIYQADRQLDWATSASGSPDVGHWKRIRHAVSVVRRHDLPPSEQLRVFLEYGRYGATRSPYWIRQLLRELGTAAVTLARRARK